MLHISHNPTHDCRLTVSDTNNFAKLRNTISDLSVSKHLGDGGRLSDLVSDLYNLGSVRVGRSTDTQSIVRKCSPISSSCRLGERVIGDTATS